MEVFLARQPIFDKQQKVYAYELLYWSGLNNYYDASDEDRATTRVLTQSFFSIGMDVLTMGKRAFINFTRNLLVEEFATMFPKELIAVEILEHVEPDEEIISTCKKLKKLGYLLVFHDFVFKPQFAPLIEMVDIIKVDFNTQAKERGSIIQSIKSNRIKFLAEKVETREAFNQAVEMGYSYFQGDFFSKPHIISERDVPAYKLNYLRLLQEINQPEVNFDRLEKIFKEDLSLSYKLLSYINSAFFGFPSEIRSIKHALALIGLREAKKWFSLIALSTMGKNKSEELVVSSLFRANLCELIAPLVGLKERASELFLMGLFSMIDAFLDRPMPDILTKLPLSEDIRNALLGERGLFRDIYHLVVSFEKGDWGQVFEYISNLKAVENELPELFIKTVQRSYQILPR